MWIYVIGFVVSWLVFAWVFTDSLGNTEDITDKIGAVALAFVAAMIWPIFWLVAIVAWLFDTLRRRKWRREKPIKPCPHGYEDWNDCPDCCH